MNTLVDKFGRKHDYMRIAVTDRCNLRCQYCMPEEGVKSLDHLNILSFEEILSVVKVAAKLGVRKIRLTGGEPLVRKDLESLIQMIHAVPGIEDIAMTTNAIFLADRIDALKAAGLSRVNISLDSLNEDRFRLMTRGGELKKVIQGIEKAIEKGLNPVKVNAVVIKGFNEDEIADFIRWTIHLPIQMRFIEYMPIGDSLVWKDGYYPLEEVRKIAESIAPVMDVVGVRGNGPASVFKLAGAEGTIGIIHPVSQHFCSSCNRLRLTADGKLKPCLFWQNEVDIRSYISDEEQLTNVFREVLNLKEEKHQMTEEQMSQDKTVRKMSQIGG
ncbi:cyclic pyranopterin phosphate synthase MoaA [Desulfuribacillus stibiiarsenatis]|uniref:GTP 3',8-cyclase n=1 Tax=Desulfuribacillus stibiiarsenatis TaxID=1390249 RepID=A0A1E5L530_9FIRM|nr:GTP 3',8-cyclase MoaA [Desulfuribacillus stibiiarsenatis]OEH85221.1 cyclic pyranopterin phosphate synthase MoaA [Desulfuribacillus stibiiarsenatis]